jgi:hypothetical protein
MLLAIYSHFCRLETAAEFSRTQRALASPVSRHFPRENPSSKLNISDKFNMKNLSVLSGTFKALLLVSLVGCGKFEISPLVATDDTPKGPPSQNAVAGVVVIANSSGFFNKSTARSYKTSLNISSQPNTTMATTASGYKVMFNIQAEGINE